MIAELPSYPDYKDSGAPWLGDVPEHWGVRRIKTLFRERDQRRGDGAGVLLSLTRARGIIPQADASNRMASAEDLSRYKVCRPGDLVMNRMQAWSGMFALAAIPGLVSPDYSVFEASGSSDVKYFEHLFKTPILVDEFARRSKGIGSGFNRLYTPDFGAVPVIVPPLNEQAAIVHFLDHADRRIRRYIAVKKKLIALLDEQRQAIIHRAVTRGLDPGVRLKSSSVEWLGDLPEHWEVIRLKDLVTNVTSGSRGWSDLAADEGPLFIRIGNLKRGSLDLDLAKAVHLRLPPTGVGEAERTRVAPDDLLLSITAFIGSVAVVPRDIGEAYVSQHVACCRLRARSVNPRWVGYVLLSPVGQTHGHLRMYGGTKQGLSLGDVRNYPVLLPPREEQDAITEHLDHSLGRLGRAVTDLQREVVLVREYRTRLIADVVSGKIDVREAAMRLPDEVAESPGDAELATDEDEGFAVDDLASEQADE